MALPALLLAGVMLAGCTTGPADEGIGNPQPIPMNNFQISWATQLETAHGPITRVFARENLVICYTDDKTVYILERDTGRMHTPPFTIGQGGQELHPPVVLKEYIVFPTSTSLEIYDRAKGDKIRSKNLSYAIRSDAVGSKTYVYFGTDRQGGGRIASVDVTEPYLDNRWELMFPHSSARSAPAVWGDIVYGAATNGDVTAVSFDTREPLWPIENVFPVQNAVFHTHGAIIADLQVDETGVYVASTDTTLCCLNRNNGKVKWQYFAKTALTDTPVVSKDMVFQHVDGVGFVALDKIAGTYNREPRWTAPDVQQILSADDKYVYVLRNDQKVVALDKADGRALFTTYRKDLRVYATNPKEGTVFTVTTGNRVLAIDAVRKPGVVGELAWEPVDVQTPIALAR